MKKQPYNTSSRYLSILLDFSNGAREQFHPRSVLLNMPLNHRFIPVNLRKVYSSTPLNCAKVTEQNALKHYNQFFSRIYLINATIPRVAKTSCMISLIMLAKIENVNIGILS